jgi:hypothetical protein
MPRIRRFCYARLRDRSARPTAGRRIHSSSTMSDENETKVRSESGPMRSRVEMWLRFVAVLGGCATFAWTAFTYFADKRSSNEAEKIKASQPFLDRQLKLFENATETAAKLRFSRAKCQDPSVLATLLGQAKHGRKVKSKVPWCASAMTSTRRPNFPYCSKTPYESHMLVATN